MLLVPNLLKKELASKSALEVCLALDCLANIMTLDLARDLIADVFGLLNSSKSIKKGRRRRGRVPPPRVHGPARGRGGGPGLKLRASSPPGGGGGGPPYGGTARRLRAMPRRPTGPGPPPRPGTVAVVGAGLAGVATVRNPAQPFPPPSPRHLGPLLLLLRSRPFQLGDERTSPSGGWRAGTPSPRRD